jgi:hypothetical protein
LSGVQCVMGMEAPAARTLVGCCAGMASSLTTITVIARSHFLSTVISVTGRYLGGHTRSHFRFLGPFKGLFRL